MTWRKYNKRTSTVSSHFSEIYFSEMDLNKIEWKNTVHKTFYSHKIAKIIEANASYLKYVKYVKSIIS